jgi:hypothetical protein
VLQILPDVDVRPPAAGRWLTIIIIVGLAFLPSCGLGRERVPFIRLVKQKQRPAPTGGSLVYVVKVFSSPSTRAAFHRPGQAAALSAIPFLIFSSPCAFLLFLSWSKFSGIAWSWKH